MVDCTGLENRQPARVREFESHRFRQQVNIYASLEVFLISTHTSTHMTLSFWRCQINDLEAMLDGGGGVLWHGERLWLPPLHVKRGFA